MLLYRMNRISIWSNNEDVSILGLMIRPLSHLIQISKSSEVSDIKLNYSITSKSLCIIVNFDCNSLLLFQAINQSLNPYLLKPSQIFVNNFLPIKKYIHDNTRINKYTRVKITPRFATTSSFFFFVFLIWRSNNFKT